MQSGASSADEKITPAEGVIVLAGATGYLGRHVAQTLSRRGFRVLAPVRAGSADRPALAGVEYREARFNDAEALLEDISAGGDADRVDAVISCLASRSGSPRDAWRVDHRMNRNLLSAAKSLRARRFVLLSAICVQKPRLAFQQAKLAFEGELAESGLSFVIVRPTAFFKSLSGQLDRLRRGKPFLLFGDGELTRCKPISEADLSRFIVDCLNRPDCRNRVVPVGGPGPAVSPREQGEWLFEALGKAPHFRSISPGWFLRGARFLDGLGRVVPRLKDTAEFARIAHYYATESMLLWNPETGRYEADATPEFGTETLRDHYHRLVEGEGGDQALGEHRMFR
ncbi:MAG: NAD(P)H-binding protein [Xanthomonadales bacterium]|jgi:divinyl chlorophyllide a 8-vinyl-reductase|nr:NAD(P)H-binding protein [Xanthomonadales bacterium]